MSQDFFQCLVCQSLFGSLWKVEKHIKKHDNDKSTSGSETPCGGERKRGMLPIKKLTIKDCFVPVVKNQIDPAFLEQYSELQAKEEPTVKVDMDAAEYLELEYENDNLFDDGEMEEDIEEEKTRKPRGRVKGRKYESCVSDNYDNDSVMELERRPRRCRVKAGENIRRAVAVLSIPEQQDNGNNEQDEDMDYMQDLMNRLSEEEEDDDNDFRPPSYVSQKVSGIKRKVGRPCGRTTRKNRVTFANMRLSKEAKKKHGRKMTETPGGFTCKYCSEKCPSRNELYQHFYDNHQDKLNMIICPLGPCGRPCINLSNLREHFKAHSDAERKEFEIKKAIENAAENGEKQDQKPDIESLIPKTGLACKFCLEKFLSQRLLKKHIQSEHDDALILKCPCCESDLLNDGVLGFISHVKALHPERCDPYNERVKEREELKLREKVYKCDKDGCGEAFAKKWQLNYHMKNHTRLQKLKETQANDPERRFACPVCQYRFKTKDNLRRHFTLHLENNPYTCDFPGCNRKFNSDYNLRRHKSLHYGHLAQAQRVYCPLCPASFSRKDKLPSHLREAHKPSDIGNPSAAPKGPKKYRGRLPQCNRIPFFPTYKSLEEAKKHKNVNANNISQKDDSLVKTEMSADCFELEEIHLVDKIILGSDGHSVHVKGEQLCPQEVVNNPTMTRKPSSSSLNAQDGEAPFIQINPIPLAKAISSDPLFEKLAKDNPAKIQDILTRDYKYATKNSYNCHLCEGVFSRAWTLHLHLKSFHNQTILDQKQQTANQEGANHAITIMCGTCAYPAKSAKDLEKHINMYHKKARRFKCDTCGVPFASKQRLHQHTLEIHTEAYRKFQCRFCSRKFTRDVYREAHEKKVHERVYKKCPECNKMITLCSYSKHLKLHKTATSNDHETNTLNRCMLCQDSFASSRSLQRHIDAIHLGKPVNKHQNQKGQRLKEGGKRPSSKIVRRGPKAAGDEWFLPILEKALGKSQQCTTDNENSTDLPSPSIANENVEGNQENNDDDEDTDCLMSILGF